MQKIWMIVALLLSIHTPIYAKPLALVFVSFSMPEKLLEETLKEANHYQMPVYLNGLHNNSMQDTANYLMRLSKKIPDLNLQIDPTVFERFSINQVPAIVVENKGTFDVLYGHLTIKNGLETIQDRGNTQLSRKDLEELLGE